MTWEDVVSFARTLPQVEESTWYGTAALKVAGKGFARLRGEADGGVVLFCSTEEKRALLASDDPAYYTTPHYDGYDAVLVKLESVDSDELRELVTESWRRKASVRARKELDARSGEAGL
jgi:hypothetical protein